MVRTRRGTRRRFSGLGSRPKPRVGTVAKLAAATFARTIRVLGIAIGIGVWLANDGGRVAFAAAPPAGPPAAGAPAGKPAEREAHPPNAAAIKAAFDKGVAELKKEFLEEAKAAAGAGRLRTEADYFRPPMPLSLPAEAVLTMLDARLDADPKVSAYIRWQLLSALPETLDEASASRAVALYRRAPAPAARFGLSKEDQTQLTGWLAKARPSDDVILTSELEKRVAAWQRQNRHLLAYRDEWYRRLPKNVTTFAAALSDAFERQNLAAGAEDFCPLVIADIETWIVTGDSTPGRCGALAELVGQLRAKPAPLYIASATIRSGKLTWVRKSDSIDARKKLTHLHQALIEAALPPAAKPVK